MTVFQKILTPLVSSVYRLSQSAGEKIPRYMDKVENFVFTKSSDTATIMLFFNAVALISSHIAQINGLKKSKREHKDYLMLQEKEELLLDMVMSLVPPMMLNNFLKKKLESGEWQTRSYIKKAKDYLAPTIGAEREELGNISYIRPIRETFFKLGNYSIESLKKHNKNMPNIVNRGLTKINDACKNHIQDILPAPNIEHMAGSFQDLKRAPEFPISPDTLKSFGFRKDNAIKEFCNQNQGLLVLVTIAYTIVTSNIIMPILKNKLSKKNYDRQLAKMGETRESIKRKKRFAYTKTPTDVFDSSISASQTIFNDFNFSSSPKSPDILNPEKFKQPQNKNNVFNTFAPYSQISSQPNRLRI